jgi:hypothetical protein
MKELTKAEETLLLTILRLKDNAYGVAIKRNIQKTTGKALPYGTLYFILEELTKKGYIKGSQGNLNPKEEAGIESIMLSHPKAAKRLNMPMKCRKKYGMVLQSSIGERRLSNEKNYATQIR